MEAEVYLDKQTGNMFVKCDGALHSVNAVIVPGAEQWMKHWGAQGIGARIFHGQVIDWRWTVDMRFAVSAAELRAARYFGLVAGNV